MKRRTLLKTGAFAVGLSLSLGSTVAWAQDVVSLRMSTWVPSGHHLTADTLQVWFKAIDEASGGTLKITIDPAPIAAPPDQYDIVREGAADLAYHVMGYTPGPFEIVRGVELPFLSPNAEIGSQAAFDWYDRNIGFDQEFQDVKVITLMVHGPGAVHTKEPVATLEDLAGVKLRVGGGGVRMSEALGATPVSLPAPQSYEAISTGVADGALFPFEAVKGFRLAELLDYHLEIPGGLYTTPFAIVMNREKFESLSPAHQQVLTDLGGIAGAKILGAGWDRADEAGRAFALENGGNIATLSATELARWQETIEFMNANWIETANAAGLDGEALLNDLRETMARYSAQSQ